MSEWSAEWVRLDSFPASDLSELLPASDLSELLPALDSLVWSRASVNLASFPVCCPGLASPFQVLGRQYRAQAPQYRAQAP